MLLICGIIMHGQLLRLLPEMLSNKKLVAISSSRQICSMKCSVLTSAPTTFFSSERECWDNFCKKMEFFHTKTFFLEFVGQILPSGLPLILKASLCLKSNKVEMTMTLS